MVAPGVGHSIVTVIVLASNEPDARTKVGVATVAKVVEVVELVVVEVGAAVEEVVEDVVVVVVVSSSTVAQPKGKNPSTNRATINTRL
jgi:hypothetical protein